MSQHTTAAPMDRREFLRAAATFGVFVALGGCAAPAASARPTTKTYKLGYLSGNRSDGILGPRADGRPGNLALFKQWLGQFGYAEARDFSVEYRISEGQAEPLPGMAAELASTMDVLIAEAYPAAQAAKNATTTVPIVFVRVNDPLGLGLVPSLARPGGNMTGVATLSGAISGKKLEYLKESIPGLKRVAVLWRSNNPAQVLALRDTQAAAESLSLEIEAFGVPLDRPSDLDVALASIGARSFDALLMLPQFGVAVSGRVIEFAVAKRLPQIYSDPEFASAGGLMALSANIPAQYRAAASLVDKILKGARPADLPVEQPTNFDFVVNLIAARRIGLTIPESVLRQASEVIR